MLGEISRCYEELHKFWKEEICRADAALRTRRVDPDDVERWRNFKASLQQTTESWKVWFRSIPVDGKLTHSFRLITKVTVFGVHSVQIPPFVHLPFHTCVVIYVTQGGDLGAIASSLFPALDILKRKLQEIHDSPFVGSLKVDLTPILRAEYELGQNNNMCFTFFSRCVEFGEMVATSPADLINHVAFSLVKGSTDLLEGAMALGTEATDVLTENDPLCQGTSSVQVYV